MFKTNSDYRHNKRSANAIVYHTAEGKRIEITVELYIRDRADKAEATAEFYRFKAESDRLFHAIDRGDVAEAKHTVDIENAEQHGEVYQKSPEDLIVEHIDRYAHQQYLNSLKPLAKNALDKLTEVQRRRFLLHAVDGLTTRQIAEIDHVSHQSVVESLQATNAKIHKAISRG